MRNLFAVSLLCILLVPMGIAQAGVPPTPTITLLSSIPTVPPEILIKWTVSPEGPWFYKIYRSVGDSSHFQWITTSVLKHFEDPDVVPNGTHYYYYVTALDSALQESPRSEILGDTVSGTSGATGTITGTVVDSVTLSPIAHVRVRFFPTSTVTFPIHSAITDSLGQYQAIVDTGVYLVHAVQFLLTADTVYAPKWYIDAQNPQTATPVSVTKNGTTTVNFKLNKLPPPVFVHATGIVTDNSPSPNPIQGARVAFLRPIQEMNSIAATTGNTPGLGTETRLFPGLGYTRGVIWTDTTDATGHYNATVVQGKSYIGVAWKDGYLPQFFYNAYEPTMAQIITVHGDTSGINFFLTPLPAPLDSLKGMVRDTSTNPGQPISGRVILFPRPTGGGTSTSAISARYVNTDANGSFTVQNVQPGTYVAMVIPFSDYSPAYFKAGTGGVDQWQNADSIVVPATGISIGVAQIRSNGLTQVSGMLTSSGTPVQGVHVVARSANDGGVLGYGLSDSQGNYTIDAVPFGQVNLITDRTGFKGQQNPLLIPPNNYSVNQSFLLVTGVQDFQGVPFQMTLHQNYPNPFNPSTTIVYDVSSTTRIKLKLYDVLGREVATLVDNLETPGQHTVTFDANKLASGVYFYRLQAGTFVQTKKMMLLR